MEFDRKMGCISSKKVEQIEQSIGTQKVAKTKSTKAKKPENKPNKSDDCEPEHRSISPSLSTSSRPSRSIRKTWTDEELLCKLKFLNPETSSNIVRLFDEGNTIPFMCRYRREIIGNLGPDE